MYLTPIIPRCIGQPRQQPSHPTNVTHVPRAASIIDQATATSELSSVQALLTDVHVAVDTGTLPATHNASMPGLDQQPSTLSRAQLVHAIWLAGVLTQREPSFAHAHAGAVGSLLVLLEQRAGGEGEGLRARQALKLLAYVCCYVCVCVVQVCIVCTYTTVHVYVVFAPTIIECTQHYYMSPYTGHWTSCSPLQPPNTATAKNTNQPPPTAAPPDSNSSPTCSCLHRTITLTSITPTTTTTHPPPPAAL